MPTHEEASKVLRLGLGLGFGKEYETCEAFFALEVRKARHQQEE
jgi:hypothetical protein